MPVDVSVVIPALNEADGIARQLRALDAQVFDSSWEVVVADNGSTDDTRSVVESFQSKHFLLRWIDASGRRGINHARNEGVAKSVGNRILLCDGDDEVEPGWLSALADQREIA